VQGSKSRSQAAARDDSNRAPILVTCESPDRDARREQFLPLMMKNPDKTVWMINPEMLYTFRFVWHELRKIVERRHKGAKFNDKPMTVREGSLYGLGGFIRWAVCRAAACPSGVSGLSGGEQHCPRLSGCRCPDMCSPSCRCRLTAVFLSRVWVSHSRAGQRPPGSDQTNVSFRKPTSK